MNFRKADITFKVIMGIVLVVAIAYIIIGTRGNVQRPPWEPDVDSLTFVEDSVEIVDEDTTYKISGSRLMTLSDSIHYFEDGF